jgi:hypothetical protein
MGKLVSGQWSVVSRQFGRERDSCLKLEDEQPAQPKVARGVCQFMKRRISLGILGALIVAAWSLGAFADIKGNPYQSIVARNLFGLRPMPTLAQPPVETTLTPPPLPEIKLLGITTLLSAPKALLQYEDKQTKKVEFPSPLSEGETYKTFTVLGIDVENERVRVRNGETETTLDFINHGVKVAPAPPPVVRAPTPNINLPSFPQRLNLGSNTNSRVVVVGGSSTASPSPAVGTPEQPTALQPVMSRDEAEALIEIARQKYQGQPGSKILLPTRLGNALNQSPLR